MHESIEFMHRNIMSMHENIMFMHKKIMFMHIIWAFHISMLKVSFMHVIFMPQFPYMKLFLRLHNLQDNLVLRSTEGVNF